MNETWELWAEMVRSDQMTDEQVIAFLQDHLAFTHWYLERLK